MINEKVTISKKEFLAYDHCRKWDVFKIYNLSEFAAICDLSIEKVLFMCLNYNSLREGYGIL